MKSSLLKKHPELQRILNKLSGKITDAEMSRMNYEVKVRNRAAADVAREYLLKEGLLRK